MSWLWPLPLALFVFPALLGGPVVLVLAHDRRRKQAERPPLTVDRADALYARVLDAQVREFELRRGLVKRVLMGLAAGALIAGSPFVPGLVTEAFSGEGAPSVDTPDVFRTVMLDAGIVVATVSGLIAIYGPIVYLHLGIWRASALTLAEEKSAMGRAR